MLQVAPALAVAVARVFATVAKVAAMDAELSLIYRGEPNRLNQVSKYLAEHHEPLMNVPEPRC